jgi:hypothetical protein
MLAVIMAACSDGTDTIEGGGSELSNESDGSRRSEAGNLDGGGFGAAEDATATTEDIVAEGVEVADATIIDAVDAASDATASILPTDATSLTSQDTFASDMSIDGTAVTDTTDTFIGPVSSDIVANQDSGNGADLSPLTPGGQCKMKLDVIVKLTGTDKCTQPDAPGFPGSGCTGTVKCASENSDPTCVCGN